MPYRIRTRKRSTKKRSTRKRIKGGKKLQISSVINGKHKNIYVNTQYITIQTPYLSETDYSDKIRSTLMERFTTHMGKSIIQIQEAVTNAVSAVYPMSNPCTTTTKEWVSCKDKCKKILDELIRLELTSTAYMLRTLYKSIIKAENANESDYINFVISNITPLNGTWEHDAPFITLDTSTKDIQNRLIMGFGPSASGKTHWAKTIINLFSSTDKKFPKIFLTIDGGLCRETSIVYQYIVAATHRKCFAGFDNLVTADIIEQVVVGKSLFSSSVVKTQIDKYLGQDIYKGKISLYVPDTIAGCGIAKVVTKPCKEVYQPYINITGDHNSWIGLLIWQHETKEECSQQDNYKCKGTTESGTSRQGTEGKKYSSLGWSSAFVKGMKHALGVNAKESIMKKLKQKFSETQLSYTYNDNSVGAPGERIRIHNCGSKDGISIMEHFTPISRRIPAITDVLQNNAAKYKYQYRNVYETSTSPTFID